MLAARAKPVPERTKAKRRCAKRMAGEQPRCLESEASPMEQGGALAASGRTAHSTAARTCYANQPGLPMMLSAAFAWLRSNAFDCGLPNV
jgi:hypothetical protein